MKKNNYVLIFCVLSLIATAQPSIQWSKLFGGTKLDAVYTFDRTTDGGFIILGDTKSSDGDVTGLHSADTMDVWMIKTDSMGILQWEKSFGGSGYDFGAAVEQTSDGGYIFCATTGSSNGDVSALHGSFDYWLVKTDAGGNILWEKTYGGSLVDIVKTVHETSDGGYILCGSSTSSDGDITTPHKGNGDLWIVKTDNSGNISWQKSYGGSSYEGNAGINLVGSNYINIRGIETNDGGFIICAPSSSIDGDVSSHYGAGGTVNSATEFDFWILKLDSAGNLSWEKSLGGSLQDLPYDAIQTNDGGFIFCGHSASSDGNLTVNHGNVDFWVVKTDSLINMQWQKSYGGTSADAAHSIVQTADGGYFVTGQTNAAGGDVGNMYGVTDSWILKIDVSGNLQWQKNMGGTLKDVASGGIESGDGGYYVLGNASSNNYDVSGNHVAGAAALDAWLLKLAPLPTHVITGTVYEDLNGNCVKDSGEVGLYGQIVKAVPGNYFATTNFNGTYSLFVDTGNYVVSQQPAAYYNVICPAPVSNYSVAISSLTPNSFGNDFADTLNSHCADMKVGSASPFFRACFKNSMSTVYKNTGAVAANNVVVTITFDSLIVPLSSNIPWTQNGNVYTFNIGTVQPFQSGLIYIVDSASCAAVTGLNLECAVSKVTTSTAECDTNNNMAYDCHYIVGSCDPNAKEVQSHIPMNGYVFTDTISSSDKLSYLIRFQNTGTDTAFKVVVRDTLSSFLDPATIVPGAASHSYSFRLYENGIAEWTFNNILLPDSNTNEQGSHGFLKFEIQQAAGNPQGTTIENGAAIWFDYDTAVKTNRTVDVIPLLLGLENKKTETSAISIYPNPFQQSTTFELTVEVQNANFTLYDLSGKVVRSQKVNGKSFKFERQGLSEGIYFFGFKNEQDLNLKGKIIIN